MSSKLQTFNEKRRYVPLEIFTSACHKSLIKNKMAKMSVIHDFKLQFMSILLPSVGKNMKHLQTEI